MNQKEAILARCIDEVLSKRSTVKQCLDRYPELRDELKPLLEVALSIQPPKVTASPEFRQRLRNHLFEMMESDKVRERRKEVNHRRFALMLPVRAVAILVLVFVVLMGGGTSVYAAQSSLPGDVLYPVKIGVEKIQVAATMDSENKAYLHLKIVQRRIDEVASQVIFNRQLDVSGLATLAAQTDAALGEIEKTSLDDTTAFLTRLAESTINQQVTLGALLNSRPETERESLQQAMRIVQRANLVAQAAYNNSAFLHTRPSVRDQALEQGRFKVDGTLLDIDGQTWNVGGLILSNVRYSSEIPAIGNRVKIEVLNKNSELFIIELEQEEDTHEKVKIEGLFKGTDESGKKWYIGEMSIDAPSGETPPSEGEKLELQGATDNGSLAITSVKKEKPEEGEKKHEAKLEGKLVKVDVNRQVITVNVAGAEINLNVSSAKIHTKTDKSIELSEVVSLIGKDISASGLVREDGTLSAREVRIDVEEKEKGKESRTK